ncbi:MAG: hypothetical protein WC346_05885 [Methanogenium sp.]
MKILKICLCILVCVTILLTQESHKATQSVVLEVKQVNKVLIVSNSTPFVINGVRGVANGIATYNIITNVNNSKIVAVINKKIIEGKLLIKLSSNNGTSLGNVDLTNAVVPINVVVGIKKGIDLNQTITYELNPSNIVVNDLQILLTVTN